MRAVLLCCVLAGCFNPSPQPGAPCNNNGDCPSGLECSPLNRCEKPGSTGDSGTDGPTVDACVTGVCSGDVLMGCGQTVTCANGCAASPNAHCRQLAPSNGLTTSLLAGATADVSMDKLNFNADGEIKRMNDVIRAGGEGVISGIRFQVVDNVAVWTASSFNLPAGESWSFGGTRPVTLFANTTITIAGSIDVGGTGSVGGPGGSSSNGSTITGGCRGRAGRTLPVGAPDGRHAEGGGGGGGANPLIGANGGASNQGGTFTGIGGGCATNPSTIPLAGGNGGGQGGDTNNGGGGGGAISLVAMETITITGDVGAPGAGGQNANGNGGGGGGGGGAILIEAPTVTISGRVTANGGGGGAPSGGLAGSRGSMTSATPALGGLYSGGGGPARGGSGGTSSAGPTVGQSYNLDVTDPVTMVTTNTNRGGGGGGAVGKIEVKRVSGGVTGLASPAAVITDAIVE